MRLFLQIVVSDDLRAPDGFFDVSRFERVEFVVVIMCLDCSLVVGEKLKAHADFVGFRFAHPVHL